jgi:hypothetical protein
MVTPVQLPVSGSELTGRVRGKSSATEQISYIVIDSRTLSMDSEIP